METFVPLLKPCFSGREKEYVLKCLENEWLSYKSPIVAEFEEKFSEYIGRESIAVSSGTAALHLALLALNVKHGDEVILPAISFGTTASVVLAVGASPVYVDTDHRGCLTEENVRKAITKRTKAIISVHLYGEIAEDVTTFGIPVIEDACEALGSINTKAAFTCYSFFANKDMTTGEGGMLVGDVSLARKFRNGGFDENYRFEVPGLNYRITALQAALGLAQFDNINLVQSEKRRVIRKYREQLEGCGYWLFVTRVENPEITKRELRELGIETRRVFPLLPYQTAFQNGQHDFPNAEDFYRHGLCLPTGWHVEPEKIIECLSHLTRISKQRSVIG